MKICNKCCLGQLLLGLSKVERMEKGNDGQNCEEQCNLYMREDKLDRLQKQ